jgi:3-hydroxyisobutyrate dehydrogenase-like beta-hydroxyacid dehydrogenase
MNPPHVCILGTGRMGSAMATRLAGRGPVVTWSRSGRRVAGVELAPSCAVAVKDADVVLLALFDAAACQEVLAGCLANLAADAVVVNTATVGPMDAQALAELVESSGRGYVHAPVMGSVRAASSGELTVLVGGTLTPPSRALLERLGTVMEVGGPSTAAALKLVAIGALGDCLVDTRAALGRTSAAGLDSLTAISVLERSPLAAVVRAKRSRLLGTDPAGVSEFTLGALAKDLSLLEVATGVPHRATSLIGALRDRGAVTDDDDVAVLCGAAAAVEDLVRAFPDARLSIDPAVVAPAEVLEPLHAYALGHATGDPSHFRRAFRQSAHIEGLREGAFHTWDLEAYCTLFDGPAPDERLRTRTVDTVEVDGTIATARMTLRHGEARFTDAFLLVAEDGVWRIANKAYHRHQ